MKFKLLLFLSLIFFSYAFSQQKISGLVTDNSNININPVLIINISKNTSVLSDASGKFMIDAGENDEIRAVKKDITVRVKKFRKKISIRRC